MKLELDGTEDHPHHHSLYSLDTDADGFPNTHTGNELVQLCKESFPQLVGLSICMCIPELAIPHIPPFVYEIVAVSPKLKYLGVEDTQCTFVEPVSCCCIRTLSSSLTIRESRRTGRGLSYT